MELRPQARAEMEFRHENNRISRSWMPAFRQKYLLASLPDSKNERDSQTPRLKHPGNPMIRKIIGIKNVGRFEDCRWRCGSQFESLTLIFGENSRGKSTFCDILRSCQTNSPDQVLGRRRLGATGASEVELRTDSGNLKFDGKAWNSPLASLAIFDTTFVHQNVYAGDHIDHEHKRNLYRVIVGEQGVKLAQRVDTLDCEIRDANQFVAAKRDVLAAMLPPGTDLKNFAMLSADADIARKIDEKEDEIQASETAARRAAEIKAKGLLQSIAAPTLPVDFDALLAEKLPTLAEEAEKRLRAHLSQNTTGATESWVALGLAYQKGDICPLCGQSTSGLDLLAAYRAYFDRAYNDFKQKLAGAESLIGARFGDTVTLGVQKAIGDNAALWEFWSQIGIGVGLSVPDVGSLTAVVAEVRNQATVLVRKKIAAPLEEMTQTEELKEALKRLMAVTELVTEYNAIVQSFNAQVTAFKIKQASADIPKLKTELSHLKLVQLRHSAKVVTALKDYTAAENAKARLNSEKTTAKTALDKYSEGVLAMHEKRINELLQMFGAGFRISGTERSYVGGKPSSTYKLVINGVTVNLGDEKTPASSPSFRNTLSAGDRSTLAFALFVSQLERDPNRNERIVVFDDPFTSQDRSRRTATHALICKLAQQVEQVFVLSHDPHFLRASWDAYKGGSNVSSFQFVRMGNGTTVGEWDIVRETTGEYAKKHRVLWDYRHNSARIGVSSREVAQTIRPVLEEYLRLKLPHSFADNEWLGDFIAKIRNAPDTDPAAAAKCIVERVALINEYSKRYHHGSNPGADTETVDEAELLTYVEQTLEVVGGF
jgi:wobble nucleotide-excising tRNase